MSDIKQEVIVCAAIRNGDLIICGVRHMDRLMRQHMKDKFMEWEQGFVNNRYEFLGRKEALLVAEKAGQIIRKTPPTNQLFSEDLY